MRLPLPTLAAGPPQIIYKTVTYNIMKISAIEFVDRINQLVSNYNIADEQKHLYEFLIPKQKQWNSILTGDFLIDLYNNYDLDGCIIGFDFLRKLEINPNYVFFASNDPFHIGLDINTNEIIMYDFEYEQVHLKIAKDIYEFIEISLLTFEYGLPGWIYEKEYSKEDRLTLLTKIEGIVNPEYLTFYEQSYGI
jgi:hypothetical protein